MNETLINVAKTLKTLDADLNAVGWDQDSRIYHLIESPEDPIALLAGVMPSYPPTDMLAAYDQGVRCPDNIHGLAVATEGYRHLTFDELVERNSSVLERIRQSVENEKGVKIPEVDADRVHETVKSYYYDVMMPRLPSPSDLPPHMRMELRILTAVLRDGTCIVHTHSRDKDDASTDIYYKDQMVQQHIPTAMYMFLHGTRPDLNCEDPLRTVADTLTLKVLANLPTIDD